MAQPRAAVVTGAEPATKSAHTNSGWSSSSHAPQTTSLALQLATNHRTRAMFVRLATLQARRLCRSSSSGEAVLSFDSVFSVDCHVREARQRGRDVAG
jgi:hypothetical protein